MNDRVDPIEPREINLADLSRVVRLQRFDDVMAELAEFGIQPSEIEQEWQPLAGGRHYRAVGFEPTKIEGERCLLRVEQVRVDDMPEDTWTGIIVISADRDEDTDTETETETDSGDAVWYDGMRQAATDRFDTESAAVQFEERFSDGLTASVVTVSPEAPHGPAVVVQRETVRRGR